MKKEPNLRYYPDRRPSRSPESNLRYGHDRCQEYEALLYEIRAMMVSVRPYMIHCPDEVRADFDAQSDKIREVLKWKN